MRLTQALRFSISEVLWASSYKKKKVKSDFILVKCFSVVTQFKLNRIRPRLADKLEFLAFDPMVQKYTLFKEDSKIRSIPPDRNGEQLRYEIMTDQTACDATLHLLDKKNPDDLST